MNSFPHLDSHVPVPNLWDVVSEHRTVATSVAIATGICLIIARVLQQSLKRSGLIPIKAREITIHQKQSSISPPIFPPQARNAEPFNETRCVMIDGKRISWSLLLNRESILKFVCHPEALRYFLEGREKMARSLSALAPEIEHLGKEFPDDPEVHEYVRGFQQELHRVTEPLFSEAYDAILGPFFAFGIANTATINDLQEKPAIQELQVQLFKNSLAEYGIGQHDRKTLGNLEEFSKNSRTPLFSEIVYPLVSGLKKKKGDLDHIIDHYIGNPPVCDPKNPSHHITGTVAMISERVQDDVFPTDKPSRGAEALDSFLRAAPLLHDQEFTRLFDEYYSINAIIRLFLRLTEKGG